jgi:predicted transcriptional regulator
MNTDLPSTDEVREALAQLNTAQLDLLAGLSGVSIRALYKLKAGATSNPGLETVRAFLPHVAVARRAA